MDKTRLEKDLWMVTSKQRKKKGEDSRKYNNGRVGEIFCRIDRCGRMEGNDGKWWEQWDSGER